MQFREDYPKKTQPSRGVPWKCPKGLKSFFHFFQVSWMDVSRICWEVQSFCFTRLFVNFSTQRRLGGAKFLGRATRQITDIIKFQTKHQTTALPWFESENRPRVFNQTPDMRRCEIKRKSKAGHGTHQTTRLLAHWFTCLWVDMVIGTCAWNILYSDTRHVVPVLRKHNSCNQHTGPLVRQKIMSFLAQMPLVF